ncbi:universal stress protein [Rhodoferax lithotrophicus]|nr:universal stress protein [Rhodoferax sp. MIZ03]
MPQLMAHAPNAVQCSFVETQRADLLGMRVFGHFWLKQLMTGSITSTLLRVSEVPVLIGW